MSRNYNSDARIDCNRRTLLRAIPLAGMAWIGSGTAMASGSGAPFPEVLQLPTGWQPEGIVTTRAHEFFVGSRSTGGVYRGDLRTGEGEILVPPASGRVAVGLSYDCRSNNLFVAGGPTGKAFVYDAETGETAAVYTLAGTDGFVNDVIVTSTAAYFTNSFQPALYRVPLGLAGRLPDRNAVAEIRLAGDFESIPNEFNANGIDAPPDGEFLIIVNTTTGLLYKVHPTSGVACLIDLGGETLTDGDGILLDGRTLYVVRNRLNEIAVVRLDPGATRGELVRTITDPDFDVPTTIAEFGSALYAVNARLGIADPENAEYDVIRVPKGPTH